MQDFVDTDPGRCTYVNVDPELESLVRQGFDRALADALGEFGLVSTGIGLKSVSVSVELRSSGLPWLQFLSTDGTSCYCEWVVEDWEDAIAVGTEFGRDVAEDIKFCPPDGSFG